MKIKDLSYEEAIEELEQILEDLQNEDLSLDNSLEKFKQGVALYNYCNEILKNAEGEIKILLKDKDGIFEEDFNMEV
ncbi:exodeoxyribonuclease VII small subunit [Schnuerera sp. xch1]|uniref:exodeoxyribonuclease VII small subunit n=1 Tax=Schnuerera sp. xch1 TaxID=2874283 RepID=UPI001CBE0B68|nr:exodeoxyribonuclease VII small subunit [Schnuerera sp. xch1]MBZ2173756.1 exodeoxyribonuclease VII small subunit [Schnuerera sp. xch1]